jgi:tetratricopeptide (TPR) repeat protein
VRKERFTVARVVDIEGTELPGQAIWHMVRSRLRVAAFGVNAWTSTEAGQGLIVEHDEVGDDGPQHEELYVVLHGSATFMLDGREKKVPAGSVVFVKDPAVKRSAVADSAGTTVLVVGSRVGEPYVVSRWERSAEALRYWPSGQWDEAIRLLKIQLAETPDHAGTVYNLACAEACAGRTDDAFEHLARALELRPAFLETAQHDPDLASLRDDPRFPRP